MKNHTVSVYDIGKALGVSPATVSRTLNHPEQVSHDTRDRVLRYIQETGFQKRSYGGIEKRPHTNKGTETRQAVFLMTIPSARNPFYGDIIEGAMAAASQYASHLYIDYAPLNDRTARSFIDRVSPTFRGILSMQALSPSVVRLLTSRIPLVQCSEFTPEYVDVSSVTIDNITAEKKATEYLISLGCKKFSFFTPMTFYRFAEDRLMGFRTALEQALLPFQEDNIIRIPGMEFQAAYDAALIHLKKTRPDAIVCISDVFAAACIKAASELSIRIPEELMIIGFDNIAASLTTSPSLTTIAQPRFQLGFHAFEILYRETRFPHSKKTQMILPTELLVRASTAQRIR